MRDIHELISLVHKPGRAVLTTHLNPDPDSVASICACAELLRAHGHTVSLFSHDSINDLMWIYGSEHVTITDTLEWNDYDVFWALDQGGTGRHGFSTPTIPTINIDHHASNDSWGDTNYVDTQAGSTCSIILRLFGALAMKPDQATATTLLTGVIADTGFFEYAHSADVFEEARLLMSYGAEIERIRFQMKQQLDPRDIEFIARALLELTIDTDKRVAYIYLDQKLWKTYGVSQDKSHLLMPYIQSIQGTDFGVICIESDPETIRLRFRARTPECDVLQIAQKIGGAGHRAAAGARLPRMSREEAIAKVLACV